MKVIKNIFVFLLVLLATNVYADEKVSLTASAPNAVVSGTQFRLIYSVNTQKIKDFRAPSMEGFEILMGPTRSHQSSTQIINGKMTSSSSVSYTYILMAGDPGTYTIPAASIVADDQSISSNSLTIKVLPPDQAGSVNSANSTGNSNNSGGANTSQSSSASNGISAQDLFVTVTANKTSVYEQEAILLTYKAYSLVELTRIAKNKLPDFKGFHSQEVDLPKPTKYALEHYNGRNYKTYVLHQYVLFPQQSGKLEIAPAQFEGTVARAVRSADPFDAFFNGGRNYIEIQKMLTTPKLTINVKALPEGKPASFSGAVGEFSITSSINSEELETNDAITIKLVISGIGNMKLIDTPEVKFPKDFDIYDPKVDNKFSLTQNGLSGNKVIEYLAIPRHPGNFKIPSVTFSYFDLKSKTYKTISTKEYNLKVARGEGNAEQAIANFTNKEELKMIGSDILFIKLNDTKYTSKDKLFFGTVSYWLFYIIPLGLFLVFLLFYRKNAVENANIAKVRTKKANKVAIKRMGVAKKLLQNNDKGRFYDEVLKALWGYISDKLNIPLSQLSKDNIEFELNKYGVNEEQIKEFLNVLHECEFARYAPGDENEAMDKVYKSAIEVISKMENNIKH